MRADVRVDAIRGEGFEVRCGPDHIVTHVQSFPKSGTVQVTVKRRDRADVTKRRRGAPR
jgi:hypothetical protein